MARILAISSHVVRGHVGLAATVPALQWLGHEVWALPTVLLASRPGLGRFARHELPPPDLAAMLAALEADGCWASLDAVLTGYFPSAAAVAVAAEAIARIKAANPQALVLVDPILGDGGRLYVARADRRSHPRPAAAARRHRHAQPVRAAVADAAQPPRARMTWRRRHAALGPPHGRRHVGRRRRRASIATLLVGAAAHRRAPAALARRHSQRRRRPVRRPAARPPAQRPAAEAALDASLAALDRVLAASAGRDVLQLSALNSAPAMTPAPDMRDKLKGALAFFHHEAAGGLVLVVAALLALLASNSPLDWLYDGFLDTPVGVRVGPLAHRQAAAAVDQRRPDGDLLLPGRPGDQARAAAGRAVHLRPGRSCRPWRPSAAWSRRP